MARRAGAGQRVTNDGIGQGETFANIATASSGAITVVAAVTGEKIRVMSCYLIAGAADTLWWTTGAGSTAISGSSTGVISLAANGGYVLNESSMGHFETKAGEALVLNHTVATTLGGSLVYKLV